MSSFAFVEYESRRDADDAYHEMHNKRIGRDDVLKIEVNRFFRFFERIATTDKSHSGHVLLHRPPGVSIRAAIAAVTAHHLAVATAPRRLVGDEVTTLHEKTIVAIAIMSVVIVTGLVAPTNVTETVSANGSVNVTAIVTTKCEIAATDATPTAKTEPTVTTEKVILL